MIAFGSILAVCTGLSLIVFATDFVWGQTEEQIVSALPKARLPITNRKRYGANLE